MASLSSPSRNPKSEPQMAGVLASGRVNQLRVQVPVIGKVVLAGQDTLARDVAQLLEQVLGFLGSVGIHRDARRRRRRGGP